MGIKVPSACLVCHSLYSGGHAVPYEDMKDGLRVFFRCGASMSAKDLGDGAWSILFKNCRSVDYKSNTKGLE